MIPQVVENALHTLIALFSLLISFASAADPWQVIDFLQQVAKHIGRIFIFQIDAVFCARDQRDKCLDRRAGLSAKRVSKFRIAEGFPDGFVLFPAPIGCEHGG